MKIVKPFRLSLLTRPYRWQGRNHLGIASIALVSLKADPQLQPKQELWQMVSEVLDPGSVLDLGVPKAEAEVLASGFAYTCHQADKSQCAVRLRVDTLEKSLLVSGDRYWLDGRSTAPLPFEQMPLDWRHTFGGPGVAANPLGIGGQDEVVNGVKTRRLPNIESATPRLASRIQLGTPAALCAYLPDWPQRMAHMGRQYDSAWLANGYPGFADDMDWRFFNAAPEDQRWPGRSTLPPGAAYELWNMHPQIPVMKGNLPDWKAVCHVSFSDDGESPRAVPLNLSTAWFFPDRERVILIWHGSTAVREDDAADVKHIMPALELRDAPRPEAHYREVLLKRIDPEKAAVHVLRDSDLVPRSILGDWHQMQLPDTMAEPLPRNLRAGLLRDHEARRAELLKKGLDPDQYLTPPWEPEAIPEFDDLPEYLERAEASAVETRDRLQKEAERIEAERDALPEGAAGSAARAQPVVPDPQQLQREMTKGDRYDQANPPAETGDAEEPDTQAAPADPLMRLGYLHSAHVGGPTPAMPSFRSAKLRRRLSAAEPGRRTFAHMNLIGADLSGMDLRGADFSQAMLTDANLSGAQLDDCNFSQAVLARANLTDASLARARLDEANIGGARVVRTNLEGASMREVHAAGAHFLDCRMAGIRMDQVQLHEASFAGCDLRGSHWHQMAFLRMAIEDLDLDQAEMLQVVWIECRLRGVSFAGAKLTRCAFVAATLDSSVDFSDAILDACSVVQGSSLSGVRLNGTRLKQCGMRGMPLMSADLSAARLDACDFSECDFSDAKLDGLSAGESLFVRADFTRASLRGAILIDANFSKAILTHCDLRGANLFRTDVSQALVDGTSLLDGAYTRHAKVWPARPTDAFGS